MTMTEETEYTMITRGPGVERKGGTALWEILAETSDLKWHSTQELISRYQVDKGTLHSALRTLVKKGIAEKRPGDRVGKTKQVQYQWRIDRSHDVSPLYPVTLWDAAALAACFGGATYRQKEEKNV
jgi:hypothetical protein